MLEGVMVCPGMVAGPVRFGGYELERPVGGEIPRGRVEDEIQAFLAAVELSKQQVAALLESMGEAEETRILAVHMAYLEDPSFLADVQKKIREERLPLLSALVKVVRDFDRVFELVEDERLKGKALDLRDVAIRVIRNLGTIAESAPVQNLAKESRDPHYILAAHKLSVSDMLHLDHRWVIGIIAEDGGLDSHPGILARSMGIPTVTGVSDLRERITEGEFVVLDASSGVVHQNPSEDLRRECQDRSSENRDEAAGAPKGPAILADGQAIEVFASCIDHAAVTRAMAFDVAGIGLYRTELPYMLSTTLPTEEASMEHYCQVLVRAKGKRVIFRLLDANMEVLTSGLSRADEANPALGQKGIRFLLEHPLIFRRQLRALLRQQGGIELEIAVPFVTVIEDLTAVREAVREEQKNLSEAGIACVKKVKIGAVIEVPAIALHTRAIAREAEFLIVSIDDLQQYLLAADRDNLAVSAYYQAFHPALFCLLRDLVKESSALSKELILFGEAAGDVSRLPFYVGVGITKISVSPARLAQVHHSLSKIDGEQARLLTEKVLNATTATECKELLSTAAGEKKT